MTDSHFRLNNPAYGVEYFDVNIPDISDFGTRTYDSQILGQALDLPIPISCSSKIEPKFQVLITIFPDNREILILLGRVDNTPPIAKKIYTLPKDIGSSRSHTLKVYFRNWRIETVTLNGYRLEELPQSLVPISRSQKNIDELFEVAKTFQLDPSRSIHGPLLKSALHPTGTVFPILQAQKSILENLFGIEWFNKITKKNTMHPAFMRWKLCSDLLKRNGELFFPQDREHLPEIARMFLDNSFIVTCTQGQFENFSFGSMTNYGDAKVQRRIRATISNPIQFLSTMTELSCAAFHLIRGHSVIAYEELGFPDFEALLPNWDLPIAIDCKRISRDTSTNRLGKVINKANKQVKALEKPCYGLVVLDVSEKVDNNSFELSDNIPSEIITLKDSVSIAISQENTSISGVLLLWDDFSIIETQKPRGSSLSLCLRRKNMLIQHARPKYPLGKDLDSVTIGNSLIIKFNSTNYFPTPWIWMPT